MKQKANSQGLKNVKLTWEEKALYGQYRIRANNADVNQREPIRGFAAQGYKLKLKDSFWLPKIKAYLLEVIKQRLLRTEQNQDPVFVPNMTKPLTV